MITESLQLPSEFRTMLTGLGLEDLVQTLTESDPSVSFRTNPARVTATKAGVDRVAWEPSGFYFANRPSFTFDPALYQGLYYVQDASSMITGEIVRRLLARKLIPSQPLRYLDLCAAPGGKTTAAIAALPTGSTVVANEFESDRVVGLVDNLERWGSPDVIVTRGDGTLIESAPSTFDIVAADVPCSGEGMMRKNTTAISQWSPALVRQCRDLQRLLVKAGWKALKPGGVMIYSTCTFNRLENEENAEWIRDTLGGVAVDLGLTEFDGVDGAIGSEIPAARFIPGRIRGEGLFVAVFSKPDESSESATPKKRDKKRIKAGEKSGSGVPAEVAGWIDGDRKLEMTPGDTVRVVSGEIADLAETMAEAGFRVVRAGTTVATLKGSQAIPWQALATSELLRGDAFPNVAVDYFTAIAFLRGEAVRLPDDTPRGFVLLNYNGRPLGFVKNVGNRANNLLPAGLRIRSANVPDSPPEVIC